MTSLLDRIGTALRQMLGVPDYERYLRHMRHAHPGQLALTRNEFLDLRLHERYSRPGSRCC